MRNASAISVFAMKHPCSRALICAIAFSIVWYWTVHRSCGMLSLMLDPAGWERWCISQYEPWYVHLGLAFFLRGAARALTMCQEPHGKQENLEVGLTPAGFVLGHISHTKPNPYWCNLNEHLRPNFFYLVHLIHVTSYKLCLVIWMPPFSLILTSNVCILLQSSQIMDTYLFHHRQGHLVLASQLLKTFSAQINVPFRNEPLPDPIAQHHRERWVALENQIISEIIQNYYYSTFATSA